MSEYEIVTVPMSFADYDGFTWRKIVLDVPVVRKRAFNTFSPSSGIAPSGGMPKREASEDAEESE
jgi:hypothetical protein